MDESYKFVMHLSVLITNRLREEKLLKDSHKSIAECIDIIIDSVNKASKFLNKKEKNNVQEKKQNSAAKQVSRWI